MTLEQHATRRDRLRSRIADSGQRAFVVTQLADIRYLSGFSGSNAVLVVGADASDDVLGTDGRYQDQAAMQCPGLDVLIERQTLEAIGHVVASWSVAAQAQVAIGHAGLLPASTTFVDGWVADLRMHKDRSELTAIRRACEITTLAFMALASEIGPGWTEIAVARRLEQLFGEMGAEDRAFETIVASGPNSALPHHEPGARCLERGDLVVIDAGSRVDGYCSDMTRTFVVGREPDAWQAKVNSVVREAMETAEAAYQEGAETRTVDALARSVIEAAGWKDNFGHGLGHGVGLDIHEAPMIGPHSAGTIGVDMVITVEPGAYFPGKGGVRIEDTLAVTATGPVALTKAPRGLQVVG